MFVLHFYQRETETTLLYSNIYVVVKHRFVLLNRLTVL